MIIDTNAWHYRLYAWWEAHIGNTPGYKENLCHYMRVVLFWAWATWFTQGIGSILYRLGKRTGRIGAAIGKRIVAVGEWEMWSWRGWHYVGRGFTGLVLALIVVAAGLVMSLLGLYAYYAIVINPETFFFWSGVVLWCILGLVAIGAALVVLITITAEVIGDRTLPSPPKVALPSPRMPSIVPLWWTWVLAKKHRICPFIEFRGEVD